MKLNKWILGALTVGALTACSDNDLADAPAGAPDGGESVTANGYLALSINLPQQIVARALNADNVEFNDGVAWEYGVNDAKLLLFTAPDASTSGNDATFLSSYDLHRAFSPTDPADDQISASSVEAVAVDIDNAESTYLWALVMLNVPEGLTMPSENQSFKDYLKNTTDLDFMKEVGGTKYIFMTNASLSSNQGGSGKSPTANPTIFTLASLGKASDAIKPSLQEARENVAGCVYVERALAKFTASWTPKGADAILLKDATGEGETPVYIQGVSAEGSFGLANINPSSYIVRNVVDFPTLTNEAPFAWNLVSSQINYFRMVGNVGMPTFANHPLLHDQVNPQLYRTYWCVDPNYNTALPATAAKTAEADFQKLGGTSAFYAKENTFTVENQNHGNTTLAVFKIVFKVNGSANNLYIINGNRESIYTKEADATSYCYQYIAAQDKTQEALTAAIKDGVTQDAIKDVNLADYLKITFTRDNKGIYKADGISLNNEAEGWSDLYDASSSAKFNAVMTTDVKNDLITRINTLYEITQYVGGVSYYVQPIKHFGQESTPWTATEGVNQTDTKEAYYNDANKFNSADYLGRYGMVRNNWYELNITSFSGLGSPVYPTIDATLSDDNNEVKNYIGIETHILSWAKRTQEVPF